MKFKKKILIPLALFVMFSTQHEFASAHVDDIVTTKTDIIDILKGKPESRGSFNLTDNDLSTYVIPFLNSQVNTQFELGGNYKLYEIHFYALQGVPSSVVVQKSDGTIKVYEKTFKSGWNVFNIQQELGVEYLDAKVVNVYSINLNVQIAEMQAYVEYNDTIPPSPISNLNYVFGDDNSVTYTYDLPSDPDFSHIEVYQDAQLIKDDYKGASLKITELLPETNYNFHFYAFDNSGNKSIVKSSTIQMPAGPDLIAPQNITNVENVVSDDSIQFSYLLPIDSDFSHLQVYRNNELIAPNVQLASFIDEGLDYETSYTYSFKSVDTSGNISEGTTLTLQTMPYNDTVAPSAPTGLDVLSGNSSLALSWFSNPENDVQGYNIYVDGVKRNGAPVFGNSYSLTNLANSNEYSIQISAVDTNGNESVLTVEKIAIPDGSKIPFFKLDNDLTDVVESTENWFSEMWLIVAFSAGIPLAFVVGNRIKALFFA